MIAADAKIARETPKRVEMRAMDLGESGKMMPSAANGAAAGRTMERAVGGAIAGRRRPAMEILELRGSLLRFRLRHANRALANALRRAVMLDVPTIAMHSVEVQCNTSMTQDDILTQRLGLVVMTAGGVDALVAPNDCPCEAGCPKCSARITLDVHNTSNTTRQVTTRDLVCHDPRVRPVDQTLASEADRNRATVAFASLTKDQRITADIRAIKGTGSANAKWNPAAIVAFRYPHDVHLDPHLLEKLSAKELDDLCASCPSRVFQKTGPPSSTTMHTDPPQSETKTKTKSKTMTADAYGLGAPPARDSEGPAVAPTVVAGDYARDAAAPTVVGTDYVGTAAAAPVVVGGDYVGAAAAPTVVGGLAVRSDRCVACKDCLLVGGQIVEAMKKDGRVALHLPKDAKDASTPRSADEKDSGAPRVLMAEHALDSAARISIEAPAAPVLVRISPIAGVFDFTIESHGAMPPGDILARAISSLMTRLSALQLCNLEAFQDSLDSR